MVCATWENGLVQFVCLATPLLVVIMAALSSVLEAQVKDLLAAKVDADKKVEKLQSSEDKLRQSVELMESDQKGFKLAKEKFNRDLMEVEERLQAQGRELRDEATKLKNANAEIADLTEKYAHYRINGKCRSDYPLVLSTRITRLSTNADIDAP